MRLTGGVNDATPTPAEAADEPAVALPDLLARLGERHPDRSPEEILSTVLHENEAVTGGLPLVVPVVVEEGAEEVLATGDE